MAGPAPAPKRWFASWAFSFGVWLAWFGLRSASLDSIPISTLLDLGVVAVLIAVTASFESGDPPRLAWGLMAGAQVLNTLGIALRDQSWLAEWSAYWMHPYVAVNGLLAASLIVFGLNGRRSGLSPPWTWSARIVVGLVAGFAVFVAARLSVDVVETWRAAPRPHAAEDLGLFLMSGSSAIADAVVVVVAALLARMFLPMARGQVARPYLLMSIGGFAYLALDGLTVRFGADMPDAWVDLGQWIFAVAEASIMAAALTHAQMLWGARWRARAWT